MLRPKVERDEGYNIMESNLEYRPYHLVYSHTCGNAVYLGDLTAACNLNFLHSQHITTVVTAALGMDQLDYSHLHLTHILYPLLDAKRPTATHLFLGFFDILEKQIKEGNVLVHCSAGISRAPTLVISYLMKKQGWSFKEAVEYIRSRGRKVIPTFGFQRQLKAYEEFLRHSTPNLQEKRQVKNPSGSKRKYSYRNRFPQGQLPCLSGFPLPQPLNSTPFTLSPPANSIFATLIAKRETATHQLRRQRVISCDSKGEFLNKTPKAGSLAQCHSSEGNNFSVKRAIITQRISKPQGRSRPILSP